MRYIIIGIVILIAGLGIYLEQQKKKKVWKKLQSAAYEILKEEALDSALQRQEEIQAFRLDKKLMLHLYHKKMGLDYVFDPEKPVTIGRGRDNVICLKNPSISSKHCEIFLHQNEVCIKDMGAMNGTRLKRKGKIMVLEQNEIKPLKTKDKIIISNIILEVSFFRMDKKYFTKS